MCVFYKRRNGSCTYPMHILQSTPCRAECLARAQQFNSIQFNLCVVREKPLRQRSSVFPFHISIKCHAMPWRRDSRFIFIEQIFVFEKQISFHTLQPRSLNRCWFVGCRCRWCCCCCYCWCGSLVVAGNSTSMYLVFIYLHLRHDSNR